MWKNWMLFHCKKQQWALAASPPGKYHTPAGAHSRAVSARWPPWSAITPVYFCPVEPQSSLMQKEVFSGNLTHAGRRNPFEHIVWSKNTSFCTHHRAGTCTHWITWRIMTHYKRTKNLQHCHSGTWQRDLWTWKCTNAWLFRKIACFKSNMLTGRGTTELTSVHSSTCPHEF